jgi:peptide deformylase
MIAIFLAILLPLKEPVPTMCSCSIKSHSTQEIIDRLLKTALKENLASLSAPQIGILKRMIVLGDTAYINPEILWQVEEPIPRLLLRSYNRKGEIVTEELFEEKAKLAQIEINHLNGG